jgi:thiamine-monophosphate kinase
LKSESEITQRLQSLVRIPAGSQLILGIGDDCAIWRPRGSADDLLFTSDLFVENVHFLRASHKARDVGYKAVARSLSDIAAMGGVPQFCLAAVAVPSWADAKWVDGFLDAAVAAAATAGCLLAGGDLTRSDSFACDITVCGSVPRGRALRRGGARRGHDIYVSGLLGGSALGLAAGKGKAWKRHLRPEARLALGQFLREKIGASAAMDLSDGVSLDLHRMCLASGLSAAITTPPRFPGASPEQALHGGEDYELLFTVPAGTRVPRHFQDVPLTKIGVMMAGVAGSVLLEGEPLPPGGFDHFRNPGLQQSGLRQSGLRQ